jgi:hypothetical protein
VVLLIVGESVLAGKRLQDKCARALHGNNDIELVDSNYVHEFASAAVSSVV